MTASKRILLVDDDEALRQSLSEQLQLHEDAVHEDDLGVIGAAKSDRLSRRIDKPSCARGRLHARLRSAPIVDLIEGISYFPSKFVELALHIREDIIA